MQETRDNEPEISKLLDPLFALLITNGIWGGVLGLLFVGGVLALDLGRIRSLVLAAPEGALALALLCVGSVVTFSSVAMGGAVMMSGPTSPKPPKGGNKQHNIPARPALAVAAARQRKPRRSGI